MTMATWYTADLHLGHAAIIGYCDRPHRDVSTMEQAILRALEERVTWTDDLWIVGDFAFGGVGDAHRIWPWFDRIPGHKHLVLGNHDDETVRSLPWTSVQDMAEIRDGDQRFTLCHYPMVTWNGARRGAVQLFGHVHQSWHGTRNSVNVGVDVWDFRPIRRENILARARRLPVNAHWKDVEPRSEPWGR